MARANCQCTGMCRGSGHHCVWLWLLSIIFGTQHWERVTGVRLGTCTCSTGETSCRWTKWYRPVSAAMAWSMPTSSRGDPGYQTHSSVDFPPRCHLLRRLVMGIRPAACKHTARRTSPKQVHSSGLSYRSLDWCLALLQTQRTELAAGAVFQGSGILNTSTCGAKPGQICRGSVRAVPALGLLLLQWKQCVCLSSRSLWIGIAPAVWLLLVLLAFLAHSCPSLYVSALTVCVEWNQSRTFVRLPWKAGKLVAHLHLSFPERGAFASLGDPSVEQCQPAGWGDAGKNEAVLLLFFVQFFSGFLFPCVAEVSEVDSELSRSCCYLW